MAFIPNKKKCVKAKTSFSMTYFFLAKSKCVKNFGLCIFSRQFATLHPKIKTTGKILVKSNRVKILNGKTMSSSRSSPCTECEEAIHVYHIQQKDEKLKLLEQSNCAKCWRPLYYNTKWPGSHESLRPPFYSPATKTKYSVAQCGHIFHTPCLAKETHCQLCLAYIKSVRPMHYHVTNKNTDDRMDVQDLALVVKDLNKKLVRLTNEVDRLQHWVSGSIGKDSKRR